MYSTATVTLLYPSLPRRQFNPCLRRACRCMGKTRETAIQYHNWYLQKRPQPPTENRICWDTCPCFRTVWQSHFPTCCYTHLFLKIMVSDWREGGEGNLSNLFRGLCLLGVRWKIPLELFGQQSNRNNK